MKFLLRLAEEYGHVAFSFFELLFKVISDYCRGFFFFVFFSRLQYIYVQHVMLNVKKEI